jgi:glycosyl transferase family 2
VSRPLVVPSAGVGNGSARRLRLLATLAVRDELRFLPGFFANVAPHVDGVVALDDGSHDGSCDFLASRPEVLEVIEIPADRDRWDEPGNHRLLVAAARRHGADWVLSLDADERLELRFRPRAERVIRRGSRLGLTAYAVRLRELWGAPDQVRVDGIWATKAPARLFRVQADDVFDDRPLHGSKAPLDAKRVRGQLPLADLEVYHLRMIDAAGRRARRERYERADPEARFQPGIGYAYLTDETGLKLRTISRRRRYAG